MSDVKRVTLTTISDVVKKGSGGGAGGGASIGGPFGALSFDGANAMSSAFGGGGSPFAGKESSAGSSGAAGPDGGKSGGAKKPKTVRLELNLFEPTAESFPEFNFSKLVHEEQKRLKKAQKKQHDDANNGFLSDPELDNDVARMARELERKYGSGTAYASKDKCARPAKLDYCDRGAGYDEDDSFIDNSEAYDELIPQEVETVGGGFYINSGQLEFKQLSNFERPDDVHRMPKPKKRALSTTSESSDDDEPPANAKKKAEETRPPPGAAAAAAPSQSLSEKPATANPEPPLQQQQLTEEERVNAAGSGGAPEVTSTGDEKVRVNGHVAKKQKLTDNGPLGAPKEKDKAKSSTGTKAPLEDGAGGKEKTNGVKAKVSGVSTQPTPVVVGAATVASGTGPGKKDENENDGGVKLIKTTTVKDMLRAKRDSLRKMEQEKKGRSSGSSRVSSSEAEEDGDGGGDEDEEDEENDEDDEEDEEEDDEDEEMGEGSDKESNESGSDEDIGSDSESSHESTSEKDAAARAKVVTVTNGTTEGGEEGQRPVTAVPTEHQQQQKDNEKEKEKERKRKESKLPDEMPEPLRKAVEALKQLAQTHAIGGKLNYFDSKVAEVLLQVDEGARAAGNSTRNAIFRHLEAQLSISRQSLQLKIKKIRIRKLEGRAKTALDQLEDTICDQMPLLLAKHELECRKVAEQRAAQASAAATAAAAAAAAAGTNVLPSGGSSDPASVNGEKPGPQPNTNTAPSTPQIRNPKKKFPWSERTRDLLWELYSIRVESFALVRPRNETEDDFVAEYLRNKVVPLWPKGWMRYEDLHKELDRRKKVLAKSAPAAAVGGPVPKKPPLVVLPPLTSPLSSALDPTWMTSSGTSTTAMNGSTKATGTPSAGGGGVGKSGSSPGATAAAPLTSSQVPGSLSPNGVSHKRGSSDHSITNIMNSPPLPPPATGRRSFDDDQLMLSPPTPTGSAERDGSSAKRPISVSPPEHHRSSLPVPDRQRWNSREDDSDSSIEIIGEYNFIGGGGAGGHVPTAGAGVIHSAKSATVQSAPQTPASTPNVLPVLNKEKYKNLIAGKNKGHGSGAGSNSPVGSMDNSPTGGVLVGPGKYSKHSPTTAAGERMTPQQQGPGGGGGGGGSLSFTTPTGSTASTGGGGGGGGGGGIRLSDVSRMKESPSAPTIDLDVHQIMKDLKEFQELQQHHSAGSSRKSDATTIPSQQQHDRSQKSKNAPIVVD